MDIMFREAAVQELIAAGRERELTPDERMWLLLRNTFDDIEYNGLIGYYCGENSDFMPLLLGALENIRALDMVRLFDTINQLFPGGRVPETAEAKEQLAEDWLSQPALHKMFNDWDSQYYELLPEAEELLDELAARIWDIPEAEADPDADDDDNIELSGDLVDYFSIDGDGLLDAEPEDDEDDCDCDDDDCDCGHHHHHPVH